MNRPVRLPRRRLLASLGLAGGAVAIGGGRSLAGTNGGHDHPATAPGGPGPAASSAEHRAAHGALGTMGRVDHVRNGFDPHRIVTDFDGGAVSRDASGRTVREYEIVAEARQIEVAPGVFYDAWTYNGRVPGPTIRATQGDRVVIRFLNGSPHPHTMHFHGIHAAAMDGVPGAGEVFPGEEFTYDFVAEPFGTHLYHCHSLPLAAHIARGLYGAFIVDPPGGRPEANELVFVLNGFDTNFDGENEVYAANTIAFAYAVDPIRIEAGRLQRAHVINIVEFDPVNSIHLHANFFHLYRTGTRLEPDELTDIVTMGQAERHMLEFTYREPGRFMFHAHQSELAELGWMSMFQVV